MKFYSLNDRSFVSGFREATLAGQAPGRGLFFPAEIPRLEKSLLNDLQSLSCEEIAIEIIRPYVGDEISPAALEKIVASSIDQPFPLVDITPDIAALELFHGPSLAFKDVGARFMSGCLSYFTKNRDRKITVLVATSGDTGGAVASAFSGAEGVEVVILYPSGKVSVIQEEQLTRQGKNIRAIEVDGNFDDCQRLVKNAFADIELNKKRSLTSANSINIARWLPQQFYYFFAYRQWKKEQAPVISVPSGNFGNICAGLLAHRSGLPVKRFIAACNANDTVPSYFKSGEYLPKKSIATISNAMDVGDPGNFARILELFGHDLSILKHNIYSCSISDDKTRMIIKKVCNQTGYLLDPHGAVGYAALDRYLCDHPGEKGYLLSTAHPVKFTDVVEPLIGKKLEVPLSIQNLLSLEKKSTKIKASDQELKSFLMEEI